MQRGEVSIVIPVWNAAEVTKRCLAALRPTLGPDDQVIVVDDGSTDSTSAVLSEETAWLTVARHETNRGFGAACNTGAALADRQQLIFLNNDTVPTEDWIADLCAPFTQERVGAAGPMSNAVSGEQQVLSKTGAALLASEAELRVRAHRSHKGPGWHRTNRLVGFCLATRTELFRELGGFDLRYGRGGYEDDDLCLRILLADWDLVVVDSAFMAHDYHATFQANDVDWLDTQHQNRQRYLQKFGSAFPVSVLVRCGSDQGSLLRTLISIQSAFGDARYEVVLLTSDRRPITGVLQALSGDVGTVDIAIDDDGWQRGQHAATGMRRILLYAGQSLTAQEVEMMSASAVGTQLMPAEAA